jgi:AraC-like DNA-binding protein
LKHFKNIENLNKYYGVDLKHPLIDIQKYEDAKSENLIKNEAISFDFYIVSFVKNFNGFIQIGNTKFDGENGVLHFIEPKQLYTCNSTNPWKGYQVLIHPDIFKKHFAHKEINTYDFFSYEVNESLLLNAQEEVIVENILEMSWKEFNNRNDTFSIPIILSYLSTLLNLTERFYARQFNSRKKLSNQLSNNFFKLLKTYYPISENEKIQQPTVQFFADKLNVTPNYLSDTIKHHSGKSALYMIHDFVIEKAKIELRNTHLTVSEISYRLGFEYPNYFSRLFKRKTQLSPSEYRKSVKSI